MNGRSSSDEALLRHVAAGALAAGTWELCLEILLRHAGEQFAAQACAIVALDAPDRTPQLLARHDTPPRGKDPPPLPLQAACTQWREQGSPQQRMRLDPGGRDAADAIASGGLVCPLVSGGSVHALALFFGVAPNMSSPLGDVFVEWIGAALQRRSMAAPWREGTTSAERAEPTALAAQRREAVHRVNNALGSVNMHADLGSMLMEERGLTRERAIFDEIAARLAECHAAFRALLETIGR
jgi:hypothetical protein